MIHGNEYVHRFLFSLKIYYLVPFFFSQGLSASRPRKKIYIVDTCMVWYRSVVVIRILDSIITLSFAADLGFTCRFFYNKISSEHKYLLSLDINLRDL
jgi:hypothetical protein